MTLSAAFLATALFVPAMPPPEYDDCEVVTNCVFDTSRDDAKMFAVRIELDATPSNGVEVVFGHALGLDDCYVKMNDGITSLPDVEAPVDRAFFINSSRDWGGERGRGF